MLTFTIPSLIFWCLFVLVGTLWITWFEWTKRRDKLTADLAKLMNGQAEQNKELCAALEVQIQKTTEFAAHAADAEKRRVATVECIALIEGERNDWRNRYWECGLGHSAAQAMLMREIVRQRAVLKHHNIKFTENPACGQVVNDFSSRHLPPKVTDRIDPGAGVANQGANPVDPTAQ